MGHPEFSLRQGSEGEGIVKPVGAGAVLSGLCWRRKEQVQRGGMNPSRATTRVAPTMDERAREADP